MSFWAMTIRPFLQHSPPPLDPTGSPLRSLPVHPPHAVCPARSRTKSSPSGLVGSSERPFRVKGTRIRFPINTASPLTRGRLRLFREIEALHPFATSSAGTAVRPSPLGGPLTTNWKGAKRKPQCLLALAKPFGGGLALAATLLLKASHRLNRSMSKGQGGDLCLDLRACSSITVEVPRREREERVRHPP